MNCLNLGRTLVLTLVGSKFASAGRIGTRLARVFVPLTFSIGLLVESLTATANSTVDHFAFSTVGSPQSTDSPFTVQLTAVDSQGAVVTTFDGTVTLAAAGQEGEVPLEQSIVGPFSGGYWGGTVHLTRVGTLVRLRAVQPSSGQTNPFHVERPWLSSLVQSTADLAWDSAAHAVLATVSPGGGKYENQLITIDPIAHAVTGSYPIATDPGIMDVASSGEFLYLTVNNRSALQRFDLSTYQARAPFSVGSQLGIPNWIVDLAVLSGAPDSVVASLSFAGNYGGIWEYNNSAAINLPSLSNLHPTWIEASPEPKTLYGYGPFVRQVLDSLQQPTSAPGVTLPGGKITYRDGVLYDNAGRAVAADTLQVLGDYPNVLPAGASALVEVDPDLHRTYYLVTTNWCGATMVQLKVYDRDRFMPIAQLQLPVTSGVPIRFLRCGTDGFAFNTTDGHIYFVQSGTAQPTRARADLSVTQSASPLPACVGQNLLLTLTVSNAGPGQATLVQLSDTLPANSTVLGTAVSSGTIVQTGSPLLWSVAELGAGTTASLQLTLQLASAGWSTNLATVVGYEPDLDSSNNISEWRFYAELASLPDTVTALTVATEDLIYDSGRDRLLASVGDSGTAQHNGLALLNPYTGITEAFTALGHKPTKMARSSDGQFLYVASKDDALVERLSLPSLTPDIIFGLSGEMIYGQYYPFYAAELAVPPNQPRSLAVWRVRRAGSMAQEFGSGIAITDNGVLRSRTTDGGGTWKLAFNTDSGELYAYFGGQDAWGGYVRDLYRCSIDASGVSFAQSLPRLAYAIGKDIKYAAGCILTSAGAGAALSLQPFGVLGHFSGSENAALVETDASTGRAFFLVQNSGKWFVNVYEIQTFDPLGAIAVNNVLGTPSSLVRWGTDGLAFRTTGGQVFLIRSSLVRPGSPADLAMTSQISRTVANAFDDITFTLVVTNSGPASASAVVVTNTFFGVTSIRSVTVSQGSVTQNGGTAVCSLGASPSGTSATLTFVVEAARSGNLTMTSTLYSATPDPVLGNNGAMKYAGGLLYTAPGYVLDPVTLTIVGAFGTMPAGTLMAPDPLTGRAFFLLQENNAWVLAAYDLQTRQRLGVLPISGIGGTPSSLVRWGQNGLAFRTSGNQLFIVRTSLVPTEAPTDLCAELTTPPESLIIGDDVTQTVRISNLGPNRAASVSWTVLLPPSAQVISTLAPKGTIQASGTTVSGSVDALEPGETLNVELAFRCRTPGIFGSKATVQSTAIDSNTANNSAVAPLWFHTVEPGSDAKLLSLPVKDLVADPIRGRLYVSFGANAGLLANTVAVLDPDAGIADRVLRVGNDPGRLALSSDAGFLYVALDGEGVVARWNLGIQAVDQRFGVPNAWRVADMAVAPNRSDQVVIRQVYGGAVALFVNGVKQPAELQGLDLFAFSDKTGELYACDGFHSGVPLFRVDLGANGLTCGEAQPSKPSISSKMEFGGGLLYFNGGLILDPQTRTVLASLPSTYQSLVEPDPAHGRVFTLTPETTGNYILAAFDTANFVESIERRLQGIVGIPTRLVRWGSDGIAFCTDSQLFVSGSGLNSQSPAADLALAGSVSLGRSALQVRTANYILAVSNLSASAARSVVMTQQFSLVVTGLTASASAGTVSWSNSLVTWQFDELAAGGSATLTLSAISAMDGSFVSRAAVWHAGQDPDLGNNTFLLTTGLADEDQTILIPGLPTRDLIYDRFRSRIYASVQESDRFLASRILVLDPSTGNSLGTLFAGSKPGQMTLSEDGRFLFVGLDGAMGARRIALDGSAPDLVFPWSRDANFNALDIKSQPGHPETIVVCRAAPNAPSNYPSDVAIYDGSTARAVVTSRYESSRVLEFSPDGSRIYGFVPFGLGFGLLRLQVSPSGVALIDINQTFGSEDDLKQANGLLYSPSGLVIDPVIPTVVARNNTGAVLVMPDAEHGRIFYLVSSGATWQLQSFETGTYQRVGMEHLPDAQGTPASLIRCGKDRLAFRTSSDQLVIVHSAFLSEAQVPPTDLAVTQSASQDAYPSAPVLFKVAVFNQGSVQATSVVLSDLLPASTVSTEIEASQGTCASQAGTLVWTVGELAPGGSAKLYLAVGVTNTARVTNLVNVVAAQPDPDYSNNSVSTGLDAVWVQGPNTIRRASVTARDLAYDRVSHRLFASRVSSDGVNRVTRLNPDTATVDASIPVGGAPDQLAMADDGRHLYLSFVDSPLIQCVNPQSGAVELSFNLPMGSTPPRCMVAIPGQPESLVLSFSAPAGDVTALYVRGRLSADQFTGRPFTLLTPTPDGHTVYAYSSIGTGSPRLFQMTVSPNGLSLAQTGPNDLPWLFLSDMHFVGGQIYLGTGNVFDLAHWRENNAFPFLASKQWVEINLDANRATFLMDRQDTTAQLAVYDLTTKVQLACYSVSGVYPGVGSLVQCEADRLAFRSTTEIFLVRSTALVPDGSSMPDRDQDGLPDAYEIAHGLNPDSADSTLLDSDGDGRSDFQEYLAGTDPQDPLSALDITAIEQAEGDLLISFRSVVGRQYCVERCSASPFGEWTNVAANVMGTGGVVQVRDPGTAGTPKVFYRVVLRLQ